MKLAMTGLVALGAVAALVATGSAQPGPRGVTFRNVTVTCPATVSGVTLTTVPNEDVTAPEGWSLPEQPYSYGGVSLNVGSVRAYATQVTCNYVLRQTSTPPLAFTMVRIVRDFPQGSCRVDPDNEFTAICAVPNTSPVRRPAIPRERIKQPEDD